MSTTDSKVPIALFIGDSITDYYRRFPESAPLGRGFVRIIANTLNETANQTTIVNRGIAGNRVRDLRARWQEDCMAIQPSTLTVLVGINDTWRRYDAADPTPPEQFASDYETILREARALRSLRHLVVMEPFLVPLTEDQARWHDEDLNDKIELARSLALRYDAQLIPLDKIFRDAARTTGPERLVVDGIHPTPEGNELLASSWLNMVVPNMPPH